MIKSVYAKNTECNALVDLLDMGSLYPSGHLNIFGNDSTVITSLRLSNPAFTNAVDGTATANYIYDATNLRDGTAATFGYYDRNDSFIWGGTISTIGGGGDMQLNSVNFQVDKTTSIFPAYHVVP